MAPLGLGRVLMQKFWSACLAAASITVGLMVVSGHILKLPAWRDRLLRRAAIALMSGALCGLSVGLGALFPNFREDNPSKIVSGFGGTLCLVGSFVFIVLFVGALAFPASLPFTWSALSRSGIVAWTLAANAVALAISLTAAILPLALARRRLKNMEF